MLCIAVPLLEFTGSSLNSVTNVTIPYIGTVVVCVTATNSLGISTSSTSSPVVLTAMTVEDIIGTLHSPLSSTNSSGSDLGEWVWMLMTCVVLTPFLFPAAFEAQQQLASSATQSISSLLNGTSALTSSSASSDSLNRVLNSVATVQLQLSALDCASVACGDGVCALVVGIPTCDCDGTGFTGQHCDVPLSNSTASNNSECSYVAVPDCIGFVT